LSAPRRIYLDNAATSWPKPPEVYAAVERYQRDIGAPAGRSSYDEAIAVSGQIAECRRRLARLINAPAAERIAFAFNGTDALNLAIQGVLSPGDHVVTTVAEHNSVLRPLKSLEERCGVEVTHVDCDAEGIVSPAAVAKALRGQTRLVAVTHASNVTGAIQPIDEIGQIAQSQGALMLVDAAQSLGHLPIDVQRLPIDLLAAPGHKGLLGPLGTGLLYIRPGVESRLRSLRQGGTGTQSEDPRQPTALPEAYEAGSLNVPGIFGLSASVEWLLNQGIEAVRRHEKELTGQLLEGLLPLANMTVYGPREAVRRVGVVLVSLPQLASQETAAILETSYHIQVRAGLHCAPLMHRKLGTFEQGGGVRFSIGPFNTADHIRAAIDAMGEIAASLAG
jgi:cysteine desulfurase family protein